MTSKERSHVKLYSTVMSLVTGNTDIDLCFLL